MSGGMTWARGHDCQCDVSASGLGGGGHYSSVVSELLYVGRTSLCPVTGFPYLLWGEGLCGLVYNLVT